MSGAAAPPPAHAGARPSPHLVAWLERLRDTAPLGPVADLACGRGRHALAAAAAGLRVLAIDRDAAALAALAAASRERGLGVQALRADLETPHGIPVRPRSCGAILVFRFLFRPLAAAIAEALAPGGLLLYETFTIDQRSLPQGPRNPAFLLEHGELARLFPTLEVLDGWEGIREGPEPEAVASLCARRA